MSLVINPSIGRRVLVFSPGTAAGEPAINQSSVPFDAGIAYVHSSNSPAGQSMINVGYTDHNGVARSQTSVRLLDRAQQPEDAHGGGGWYAVWMEYQFNQALRAQQPKPARVNGGDIELVKLSENGRPVENKTYNDGTRATGVAPMPGESPAEQDAGGDAA